MTAILVGLVVFVVGSLVAIAVTWRNRAAFAEKFPAISDEEFVARCTPGTRPEVALKVRRIIADHLAVEYERIHPSLHFIEDIGAD